jgi:hypothetical protein
MSGAQDEICEQVWGSAMNPPRVTDVGLYFPMCREHKSGSESMAAMVVGINDDNSLNLTVWNAMTQNRGVLGVPTEDEADDGVHFFRAKL